MAADAKARKPAQRRVTSTDVARSLGISRATVGYVLNNTPGQSIPEVTRKRVLDEAARLGYRPHAAAQALARGSSRIVLHVLPDWPMEFTMREYLDETAQLLDRAGYSLVTWTRHLGDRSRPLWETLDPAVVTGHLPFTAEELDALRAAGVQHVHPERPVTGSLADIPAVGEGAVRQVDHLADRGHTSIAVAGTTDARLTVLAEARIKAARRRARERGIPLTRAVHLHADPAAAGRAVARWVRAGVTAVVAFNDESAAAILSAALGQGLRVPDDLAVVGHDDTPFAALYYPPMSSVRLDSRGVGRYFAEVALTIVRGGSAAEIPLPELHTEVVTRATT
ncbi:LacI family DNA-binding transcriptional regulator [Cryptosporangium minutisporangium]|uniref:LacI family DNA-binding transcriptional regulator n=1 Tax=Cryptosporangium minutisporangium TaxID=113569 RepID=A0ABP6SR48_9ACTN